MAHISRIRERFHQYLDNYRVRISRAEALPQLALLGVISGIMAGLVIIAFRLLIEETQAAFLPGGDCENYEGLDPYVRIYLAVGGGLLVGLILTFIPKALRRVGVVHVMERLSYHQGRLPLANGLVQFFGGALCLIAGHSVGREGPSVHLGATSGSLTGQVLNLPHNSLRILTGCGVAAAIAASFNTPMAGVIFAMEVVMMEYSVIGFAPVILAAVCATAMTRFVFGADPAFSVPPVNLASMIELPYVVVMGLVLGALSALFIWLLQFFIRKTEHITLWVRTTAAGMIVGLCALISPEIMSIGYDTVNTTLLGELGFLTMFAIVVFKLFATTAGLGLGLPGGLIGPTLIIGAAAGGVLGVVGQMLAPADAPSSIGFYALIGMGGMMSGVLQAPLAALMAMLELTGNPNIIMPGMLCVITALITARWMFRQKSVFLELLHAGGMDYRNDPISQSLRSVGVAGAMDRSVIIMPRYMHSDQIQHELEDNPRWILIRDESSPIALMPAVDLLRAVKEQPDTDEFDLMALPADRMQVASIPLQATLQEALDKMDQAGAESLCIRRPSAPGVIKTYGVLTRQDIERNYRFR